MEFRKLQLSLAILGCVLFFGKGQESCNGHIANNGTFTRNVTVGQSVTLLCDLDPLCLGSLWAFRERKSLQYLTSDPCRTCGESFTVIDVRKEDGINSSLNIYNITKNLAGNYDCTCRTNGSNVPSYRERCFHITVYGSCKLSFTRNGMLKVTVDKENGFKSILIEV